MEIYYQPFELPKEMYSFQVFATKADCEQWLANKGYIPTNFEIAEYKGEDIEEHSYITHKEIIEEQLENVLSEISNIDCAEDNLLTVGTVTFVDEKIDDGVDEGADTYVMLRSYDVTINDITFYVRLYFGDNTREVTYYDIQEY